MHSSIICKANTGLLTEKQKVERLAVLIIQLCISLDMDRNVIRSTSSLSLNAAT